MKHLDTKHITGHLNSEAQGWVMCVNKQPSINEHEIKQIFTDKKTNYAPTNKITQNNETVCRPHDLKEVNVY